MKTVCVHGPYWAHYGEDGIDEEIDYRATAVLDL